MEKNLRYESSKAQARLPREAVDIISLELLMVRLDGALGSLLVGSRGLEL